MPGLMTLRAGILFAVLPLLVVSCGERTPTEPSTLASEIPAVPVYDAFYSPIAILTVAREILIDARATQIEWDVSGAGNFVLMSGAYGGGGGEFYANVRAQWTRDQFEVPVALQLLVQWPDLSENRLDHPIVNDSIDVFDSDGNPTFDCNTDDRIIRPGSWHRGDDLEDQLIVEIFPASSGGYPRDVWRWGACTTDLATPVSPVDFPGVDNDSIGAFNHPQAGFCEDRWDAGPGAVSDLGRLTYEANYTVYPTGVVPNFVAGKGTRDSRLNRAKLTQYVVWRNVAEPLRRCQLDNPVRIDDAAQRDKSWNPGDYVPGWVIGFPFADATYDSVQSLIRNYGWSSGDVLAKGAWEQGKWGVEIRRLLDTGHPADDLALTPPDPKNPDAPPNVYGIRITIRDGQTKRESRSAIIPLVLRPVPPK